MPDPSGVRQTSPSGYERYNVASSAPTRSRNNESVVPDWLPPLLAAALTILLLNLALLEQRRRERRRSWHGRLLRELRAWDGRLPDELDQPRKRSR
jgi:hypothetical protein